MSIKTWYTAEDINNDIPMISGRRGRVASVSNIGQGYMVIGNAPPPVRLETEDDEMQEMFGSIVHEQGAVNTEHSPPDLQGITNLLRMVQGSDDDCDNEDVSNITQPSCVVAISKPNRLNPNVKEFIPKGALSSHSSSSDIKTDKAKEAETNTTKPLEDRSSEIENVNNVKLKIDEDYATKLKNEITDTKTSDSFEAKKQKNVAIATLLRMYAANNNTDLGNKLPEKPQVKLMTPDYFENGSSPVTPVTDLENGPVQESLVSTSTETPTTSNATPDYKGVLPSSTPSCSSMASEVKSEPVLSTQEKVSVAKAAVVDPAVKKSIEKVTQWFGEPVQMKPSTIYTGPITYKKKDPIPAKFLPTVSTDKKAQNPVQGQYQPSDYAIDLGKKYEQRNRNKKNKIKNKNMWTDLDIILKERDEELAQKRRQQASSSSDLEAPQ